LGEALAQAGGIDFATADKTIRLIRPRAGIQENLDFDIRDLSNPKISNVMIYDGDYIYVPPSKAALRNVKNQRASAVLQPIALTLNVVALLIALFR
jgi:polysaccharide export outer membrane protein